MADGIPRDRAALRGEEGVVERLPLRAMGTAGALALAALIGLLTLTMPGCGALDPGETGDAAPSGSETTRPGTDPTVAPSEDHVFRGLAAYGHEVRSLRPCGSEETLWAVDPSGLLWDLHEELTPGVEPYEEVFAILRAVEGPPPADGFGADYPGEIRIEEVLYVAGEGFGCDFDCSRFVYRAQGNEPFWWAEVTPGGGMRLGRMGEEDQAWSRVQESRGPAGILFSAASGPGQAVELILSREPCRDTMSGSYFGLTATLRFGARELRGCALPGTAAASVSR